MALALSPQRQTRPVVAPMQPRRVAGGIRLSTECRTRRNEEIRARYLAEARARQRKVYLRRRAVAALMLITIAAAACLGVRAMASRGDGSASLPTVTPNGSTVLVSTAGAGSATNGLIDVSNAFIRGDQVYVVQPGDTLWSIASSLTDGSIRGYVNDLIELNGSAAVEVGQRLVLPVD